MSKSGKYDRLLERMMELALGRNNDVARLVLTADEINARSLGRLDLGQVAELKRLSNGTVEVRLLDRLKLMELLADLLKPRQEVENMAFWRQLMEGGNGSGLVPRTEEGD